MSNTGPSEMAGVTSAALSAPPAVTAAPVMSRFRVKRLPLSRTICATFSCSSGVPVWG